MIVVCMSTCRLVTFPADKYCDDKQWPQLKWLKKNEEEGKNLMINRMTCHTGIDTEYDRPPAFLDASTVTFSGSL